MTLLAFIEGIGSPIHWLVIGFVALLIFGRRLPEVGRSLGKGITEFKKGLKDVGNPDEHSGQPQDPYQQQAGQGYNQQQIAPPQRGGPQQYQQPYQGGYPQQQPLPPAQRVPQQQPPQSNVRVTRNDMVD